MAKVKVWKENSSGQPSFPTKFKVTKRWEGNSTDVLTNSNKFYHAEIQVALNGKARIFTMYGRVGKTAAREYRYYSSEDSCISDYESLIKKKRDRKKNPYREVDLAITSVGSDGAKEIKKPMTGVKVGKSKTIGSSMHPEVQRLVSGWFGSTGNFITMTLKCPLGQLTKEQIDKGRLILDDCKKRVNVKTRTANAVYDTLTSQFYSLIPHVLPHKINPDTLRLNTLDRIMEKHDTLDTFLDAKNVSTVLSSGTAIDEQYKKLNASLSWIDPKDPRYKWIVSLLQETRASNHTFLGNIKIFNIFELGRNNEEDYFYGTVDKILSQIKGKLEPPRFTKLARPDLTSDERKAFIKANVWPLWHGTRPQNMVGIITRGLLIRPSGAVHTGSMFGDALYHAESSSKSMNYCGCRGAYWSGKAASSNRVFLFLEDVIVGKPFLVTSSRFFRKPPNGYHSVYAVPSKGYGGLYNSENMTYTSSGPGQQHRLRYIVEFQANM
jgi:poly [ADP-ribose] polymerase